MTARPSARPPARLCAVLFLLCLAAPLRAQQPSQSPAEPLHPESFEDTGKHKRGKEELAAVGQAVELAFGATVWAQVKVSTMGAAVDLSRLYHDGFYKLELIELVVLSARGGRTLQQTVEKRRKGQRLASIALDYNLDPDQVYEQSLRVEEIVDQRYLPRFPDKRPRRDRSDEGYGTPYYYGP